MTSAGPETLVEPIQEMRMNGDNMGDIAEGLIVDELEVEEEELVVSEAIAVKGGKTRTRRRKGRKNAEDLEQDPAAKPAKETTRSKGWRQTPLLEPNPSFQPFSTLKRKNGRRGGGKMEENGWATEDATDVQDMGDFDFVGGLAKFDKSTVFNQIQAEDSVADEDRLVAHNRLPKAKPGTAGGKNLHYTENVLDGTQNGTPKLKADAWKSEAGESELEEREERASQRGSGSGRVSRRADSKLALNRRSTSRKGSTNIGGQPVRAMSVGFHSTLFKNKKLIPQIPTTSSNPSFLLIPSGRPCETISALQMLNLENIADNDLGLTEDMMTENAGRGIAEVTMSALESKRPLVQSKKVAIRNVIVFAGNNKSGLRAISAARHIRNHGINVVICVLGLERESELLAGLRRQIKVFRSLGGKIISKNELLEYVKTLDAPIELIIDGLLGLTISFEELRRGDQAAAYELIEWANRSKAPVLAIDIPTGIDPTSGKVSIIDGRRLYIHARFVVAMGAPKKGLLDAMALGEGVPNEDGNGEWLLYVADLGLGSAVWKKAGTKIRRGVEFEGSWVLEMKFQGTA